LLLYEGKDAAKHASVMDFAQRALGEQCQEIRELLTKNASEDLLCGKLKVLKALLPKWRAEKSKVSPKSFDSRIPYLIC
jgi:hypothetical protein